MGDRLWRELADAQAGLLSRRQLRGLGVTESEIRHHVAMERWAHRSSGVVSTTTGPLSLEQRLWLGVLHAGPTAMVGGLSAAERLGLKHWGRDDVTILVGNPLSFDPLPGFRFFRTRRPFKLLVAPGELPTCRIAPAVLLFASTEPHLRTALGAVTATVQQRLTTPDELLEWIRLLTPLRRARHFRELLGDVTDGAQSLAEVDFRRACRRYGLQQPTRQRVRYDRRGRKRCTDNEWQLPNGILVILEIDGAFHDDVLQATEDRARNRRLSGPGRIVVQCTAWEARHEPERLIEDLIALGVPRS